MNTIPSIYLTIDDSPSKHTEQIVDILLRHRIPALFFARGEFIETYRSGLVYAIKNRFVVGNHSYSHPYFSEISVNACKEEIQRTEALIENCYETAQIKRPAKIIRFPWSDRGAGPDLALPNNDAQHEKCKNIQVFLKNEGFQSIVFTGFHDPFIDAPFSWKTGDFRKAFINEKAQYTQALEQRLYQSTRAQEIVMLHDFDHNFHLFELAIEFFTNKNISFLSFEFN